MKQIRFRILNIQLFERMVDLRLPFRFGVVTLYKAPQAFVKVTIEGENGETTVGGSAELMVPKWFDKSGDLTNEDNFNQLRVSLNIAKENYIESNRSPQTAFEIFESNYHTLVFNDDLNPLAASFGAAVIDKAILDALCRLTQSSFAQAVQQNLPGIKVDVLAPDLIPFDLNSFLKNLNQQSVVNARHTVGLLDPLTELEQPHRTPVNDGLPETLEQVIQVYQHRFFKIKVMGNLPKDLARLVNIAEVLDQCCDEYSVTLDGNEQYSNESSVLELWNAISTHKALVNFTQNIIFVEQPINRNNALTSSVAQLAQKIPVIIDESDATIDAFLLAKDLAYTGVSSKTCKGLYKSIINAARCAKWNRELGLNRFFMSAEDLTCQAGLAIQQDLALISLLGITHVERNGHHYVNGMAGASEQEQIDFLEAHNDLYAAINGRTCTTISNGQFSTASLQCIGYATAVLPNWAELNQMKIANL